MLRVSNRACIRQLSAKSFRASRSRNIIAALAIALTTILFTALFTVGLSMNEAFQQSNFRQAGGYNHGTFKYLTKDQFELLQNDPLIQQWGLARVLGMAQDDVLRKNHVEVRHNDANASHWMFLDPIEGRLPQEGTNEAATDLEVLKLLGVEPQLGTEFTVTVEVCGKLIEQTFTLCGWWEKDPIVVANHILIPNSRVDEVLQQQRITLPTEDRATGSYSLEVMFKNSRSIEKDMRTILERNGFQTDVPTQTQDYISIGVNWGYTGAQLAQNMDLGTALTILLLLLLIMFTGYLIIYNVFQISVASDIRFYGLLKTIGTTGRQIKAILRRQALLLCAIGIPLGCAAGWVIGAKISPFIMSILNGLTPNTVSISPWIFIGSAVFSLLTVLLSCARPGRMAARVSPVEAVRYTEGSNIKKKHKKGSKRFSVLHMSWANFGRSKSKTLVTIISLTLALVILQLTNLFSIGFDMDKYLQDKSLCDFILADGAYFVDNLSNWMGGTGILPEAVISDVQALGPIADGGRVYGQLNSLVQFAPENWVQQNMLHRNSEETVANFLSHVVRSPDNRVMSDVQTYGMEPFILDQLTVLEGDLAELYQPGSRAVAAVYSSDDYGKVISDSHWAKLGDTVTMQVVDQWEYHDLETGEVFSSLEEVGNHAYQPVPRVYHEETFTVKALVMMPHTLSYRYFGSDEFILNDQTWQQFTNSSNVMLYAFDMTEGAVEPMEQAIQTYIETINPRYGYESRQLYSKEFEQMRSIFVVVGGLLSFIVGMVGVLNFVNAILTGILTRCHELAMLQSIGMTNKQLNTMLITEGLLYALGSVVLAVAFSLLTGPVVSHVLSSMFWFFTYKLSFTPMLIVAPIFALLGCLVPLLVSHHVTRQSIVERLRKAEN